MSAPNTLTININKFSYRSKMAGFDYDQTLVKPKTKSQFSKDTDDWQWLRDDVPEIIKKLYKKGYCIVIFTNQTKTKEFKLEQIRNVLSQLEIPVLVYIEFNKDFKKPNPHMYNMYIKDRKKVNKSESFYVGDALGRPGDHSDSDKVFAENCGIRIVSPEEMFPFKAQPTTKTTINIPAHRELVLMVGYPGSGKSTYTDTVFGKMSKYTVLHGDDYKTEAKIKKAVSEAIKTESDKSIVLDATNASVKKRKIFIDIANAAENKIPVRAIHISTGIEEAMHRNLQRDTPVPKIALYMYRKNFEQPTVEEGLYEVVTI